jgi:predicted ATPase/class 3 adenylate cyclase
MSVRDDSRELLPRGTVTMLFADLEGSTKLLDALGHRYTELLARQRDVVRVAVSAHGGSDVDWAGDGVFAVFAGAGDAVSAAASLQRALAEADWPDDADVRLRVGVHTGEPQLTEEGYVGMDVHRAARICAAAHGGQVVVSEATRQLVGEAAFPGISFLALGRYRLKDLPEPEPLFQLVGEGLAGEFPPLRSLTDATLPALHHRLVGRERELDRIEALLATPGVRLVTICGPGGAGKSRLALEVAANAAHDRPVYVAGLASISDPELLSAAIARAVGVRESPERTLLDLVNEHLSGSGALLVLDNFEHLLAAVSDVARLLEQAKDFSVVATSRSRLNLTGERVVALDPLPQRDATTLFQELAEARGFELPQGSDETVQAICRRLDGLPLAIELVVARLALLSPAALLRALGEGVALSVEGPIDLPERHRTLRATIEWSYGLLNERQRELHSTLAVFAGGCSLDDGRAVAGAGAEFLADVEALVSGSLLRTEADTEGEPRLAMLETVREYAIERLSDDDRLTELRQRHAERFLALSYAAEDELAGPEQAAWLDRLEGDHDNLRAALDWLFASGRVEDALTGVSALGRFWRAHGHMSEARSWLRAGLANEGRLSSETAARALWTEARQAVAQGDDEAARPSLERALALFQAVDSRREATFALSELAFIALRRDDVAEAERRAAEALDEARAIEDDRAISGALNTLGTIAWSTHEYERACELYEQSLAIRRRLGDPLLVANSANNLGEAAMRSGDLSRAQIAFEESLSLARELGDALHTANSLYGLGGIALVRGESRAGALLAEALELYDRLDDEAMIARCVHGLGGASAARGNPEEAARLWGAADALRARRRLDLSAEELEIDAQFADAVADQLGLSYWSVRGEGRTASRADVVEKLLRLGDAATAK